MNIALKTRILAPEQIFCDLQGAIPPGKRKVPNREIQEAIQKAFQDHQPGSSYVPPKAKPIVKDGKQALRRIIDQAGTCTEADLWEASPIRIDWEPSQDTIQFLSVIYEPNDLIFIDEAKESGVVGQNIRTAAEWIQYFNDGGKTGPHFIVNPLSGNPAPKKSGEGETLRGDANVKAFRYCLVEFDGLSREDQVRFWSAAKLPVRALIDTGGKSIHALLDIRKLGKIESTDQWDAQIKDYLYAKLLVPMGVDSACSNPAHLSRLPGHFRAGKGKFQRLLWLSSERRRVLQ